MHHRNLNFRSSVVVTVVAGSLLASVLILATVRPAAACGACLCDAGEARMIPAFTRVAPTNFRPLVVLPATAGEDTLSVLDSSGAAVATQTVSLGEDVRALWLEPSEPTWGPNGTYEVRWGDASIGHFETTAAQDRTAPALAAAELLTGRDGSGLCTPVIGGTLVLDSLSDDEAYEMIAVLEIGGKVLVLEPMGDRGERGYVFGNGTLDDSCLALAQAELSEAGPIDASLEVFDQAGNGTRIEALQLPALGEIAGASCPGDDASGDGVVASGDAGVDGGAAPDAGAATNDDTNDGVGEGAGEGDGCSAAPGKTGGDAGLWILATLVFARVRRRSVGR